jgi:hypothetical protein
MWGTCEAGAASSGSQVHNDAPRTALDGTSSERLDSILRALGFLPGTEERLRRLEFAVGELLETWAETLESQAALQKRVEELERSLGRLRRGAP